ncbi:hypothetical protein HMI54_008232 [Coelomomyces lativittatus]|nr:hypothetical protein HMI54_008232 [Coelomomyces lativittatus]
MMSLSISPYLLHCVTRPLLRRLQSLPGIQNIFLYVDDFLFELEPNILNSQVQNICATIKGFSFLINYTKSNLNPSTKAIWLGLEWDNQLSYYFPTARIEKLNSCLYPKSSLCFKEFQHLFGFTSYIASMIPFGQSYLRHWKNILSNWTKPFALRRIPLLTSFANLLKDLPHIMKSPKPTTTIAVDATPEQIAIQISPNNFKTYKSPGSIFFNETKAIFLSLFLQPTKRILSDNQAAIASFKRGFSTNMTVNKLFQRFLRLFKSNNVLSWPPPPHYIPSEQNPANAPSRDPTSKLFSCPF